MQKRVVTVEVAKLINSRIVIVKQKIEVTEEIYSAMMRPEWREQKQIQRAYEDINLAWENYEEEKSNWIPGTPDQFTALGGTGEPMSQLRMGLPLSLDRIAEDTNFEASARENVEAAAKARLLTEAFEEVLNDFSERNKHIMSLLLIDGMTEREVAEIVGCSQKTVNNTKNKLLPIIQDAMKDWK